MNRSTRITSALAAILIVGIAPVFAQTSDARFEVGGQIGALRLSRSDATSLGVGGRLTYDISRLIAVEGEFGFFPHDEIVVGTVAGPGPQPAVSYLRRRSEAFFGPKIGVKGDRFGVFGRVRPGFTRLSHRGVGCAGEMCALILVALPIYHTEFALDYGGGVELYPSNHTVARFDLGSTMVRHRSFAPLCGLQGCTSQNFTSRFSVGLKF